MANSRLIKVDKAKLIEKIQENKENHVEQFEIAVVAYKKEATKQMRQNIKRINREDNTDDLSTRIKLTAPENRVDDYEKLLNQFEWELDDTVTLSQGEFNQYVNDETDWAISAKVSNSVYSG